MLEINKRENEDYLHLITGIKLGIRVDLINLFWPHFPICKVGKTIAHVAIESNNFC